ncbi:MAG: hypothetical protein ABH969_00515 [Pseudomonadota bacterium]
MHRINLSWKLLVVVVIFALAGFFSEAGAFQIQTSDENAVRVDVKPIQLTPGKPAIFEIRLNTHSVELSYDMVRLSSLQDSQGKVYKAMNWKGSSPGGHHRRGVLEFPELQGNPQSIQIIMQNISGVPQRIFEWKLREKGEAERKISKEV